MTGVNAANAAVRLLQCFCRDTSFREVLAADKRSYDFVPLMNAFDPIASIMAMDLFGLLSSVSEFTISEGILFVCKELSQPRTPGLLMKAMETISQCAQNRHYLAYFPDSIRDICRLIVPSKHLDTPDLDTVFIVERALVILPQLTAGSFFSLKLIQGGVLSGLLEIIIEGYTYEERQHVYPICKKKTQHLDLPILALKIIRSLANHEECREALLKSSTSMVLVKVLSLAGHQIFNGRPLVANCDMRERESRNNASDAFLVPSLLTVDTARALFFSTLSLDVKLAMETLYILCLSPFDSTELFIHYPMACEVMVAFWGADATAASSEGAIGSARGGAAPTNLATTVLMRLGVGYPSNSLSERGPLPYTPDAGCVPALSRLPWQLLVKTSQIYVLADIIQYNVVSTDAFGIHSMTFDSSPTGLVTESKDGERPRTLDVATIYKGKITAAAAFHAAILADAVCHTPSSASPFGPVRQSVVNLCANQGLFASLESLALRSIEAAFLLSEIFSWEEINFRFATPTFFGTILKMLESTHILLQRTAIKMLFNAVQHSPSSKANVKVHMPRNVAFRVTRETIKGCLQQLKSRSDPLSAGASTPEASGCVPFSDILAYLRPLPVEGVTQLLLESLVVATCYFDQDLGGDVNLSEEEVQSLAVACRGLIEILESVGRNDSTVLSATSKSLWSALLNLSKIKECAQVLLNTHLLRFLKECLVSNASATHVDLSFNIGLESDRFYISCYSLRILRNIIVNFPIVFAEQLLREDLYPMLFSLLKETDRIGGVTQIAHDADGNNVNFQIISLLCSSSCASLTVCEALIALNGFAEFCMSSVTELYTFLLTQGSIENHASGDSIFKDPVEDRNTRDPGVDQTQNQESRDLSRISAVNSSRSRVHVSLEQRVALLANISRIPVGKATVFSSTKFVSILSNLIIRSDELLIPSAITFAALCVILAISPLYHCPSSYPQSALSATALETKTALSETIVAQLVLAILAVSASSSDLTVIDKVSRYVEFP